MDIQINHLFYVHDIAFYSFRMFSNEDVTIGAWMLAMNVNHEDNRQLCQPECTPTSIAVWDIPKCSGQYLFFLSKRIRCVL